MTRVSSPPVAERIYRSQDAALEGRRRVGFWGIVPSLRSRSGCGLDREMV